MLNHNAVETLRQIIQKIDGAYAPTTIRAYKADFAKFIEFCESRGESALPAMPISIASYIVKLSAQYSSAFIRRIVVSISSVHRLNYCADPTKDPDVNLAIRRMHRQIGRHHNQAQAKTWGQRSSLRTSRWTMEPTRPHHAGYLCS